MIDAFVDKATVCLQNYGWHPLWVHRHDDVVVHGVVISVCSATVSTPEMAVFDSWITDGGGMVHCVNIATFPTFNDVIAYHIGKLVVDGPFKIVLESDGSTIRRQGDEG